MSTNFSASSASTTSMSIISFLFQKNTQTRIIPSNIHKNAKAQNLHIRRWNHVRPVINSLAFCWPLWFYCRTAQPWGCDTLPADWWAVRRTVSELAWLSWQQEEQAQKNRVSSICWSAEFQLVSDAERLQHKLTHKAFETNTAPQIHLEFAPGIPERIPHIIPHEGKKPHNCWLCCLRLVGQGTIKLASTDWLEGVTAKCRICFCVSKYFVG